MTQCYFKDKQGIQCKLEAVYDDCWCTLEHKKAWQKENTNYVIKENGKPKLTIKQMQDRLLELGKKTGDAQKKMF